MRTRWSNWALGLYVAAGAQLLMGGAACAQDEPSIKPSLRIISPFAAPLWRAGVDESETYVVTGSAHKAVSVWSLLDLSTIKTLRIPIRTEQRKRAHAVAISPDGNSVAISVPPDAAQDGLPIIGEANVYVIDRKSGKITATIGGVPTRPQGLRFSRDGKYIASVLSDGCGVRVWDARSGKLFGGDDVGYAGTPDDAEHCAVGGKPLDVDALPDTTGLDFARVESDIWFVTSGATGLRAYKKGESGISVVRMATPEELGLQRPGDVDFSPDDSQLVVGERRDRSKVGPIYLRAAIISVETLRPARDALQIPEDALISRMVLDPKQNRDANQSSFDQVAWVKSEDYGEEFIFVGGVLNCRYVKKDFKPIDASSRADLCIARFPVEEGEDLAFYPTGSDRVMDLIGLPKNGGVLFATQRSVGAIDFNGDPIEFSGGGTLQTQNPGADFRGGHLDFLISEDANTVQFMDYRSRSGKALYLRFDVKARRLTKRAKREDGLIAPNHDKTLVRDWRNRSATPAVFDSQFEETPRVEGEIFRSAAGLSDTKTVVLGSSEFVRVIDYLDGGPKVACRLPIEFEAYRANITPDGKIAVIGHSDGTLRWYRIRRNDGSCGLHELLAVHISLNDAGDWTWSAWLPSGKFANDPSARDLFGWQRETEPGKIDFVPRKQMLELYDTGAVSNALDLTKADGGSEGLVPQLKGLIDGAANVEAALVVALPSEYKKIDKAKTTFTLFVDESPTWPRQLTVKTGAGVNIEVERDDVVYAPGAPIPVADSSEFNVELTLPESVRSLSGVSHICFYLDDKFQACHPIRWTGKKPPERKRRLWAIFIGISKYKDSDQDLKNAHNDALDLAQVYVRDFQNRAVAEGSNVKPDFESIHIDLLVSPGSDATSAKSQIDTLAALPYVDVRQPTRKGILAALQNIVDRDEHEELSNDLVIVYFSGHGYIHPFNKTSGRTLFVTYETDPELPRETLAETSVTSADLLASLKKISAEKLVIIDACRNPAADAETAMDPGMVNTEFADQVLSAHYFFSGRVGQYSLDQSDYVFDMSRPESERGNGLFTYGLLKSLNDPNADLGGGRLEYENRIEITEVKRFLYGMFALDRPNSIASRVSKKKKIKDIQQPYYVPARRPGARRSFGSVSVLRSLDME